MKVAIIGDEVLVSGFMLLGFEGYVTENPNEALKIINDLIKRKEVGIIFISEKISKQISNEINEIRRKISIPIISEIPTLLSPIEIIDYRKLLRQIVGV